MTKIVRPAFILMMLASCIFTAKAQTASFTGPDTVCVNTPVNFTNTSIGASSYYWNFCVADLNATPTGVNLGNPSSALSWPVFMDYVKVGNNYYGFVINYDPGGLVRLDFGNSLLNTPTAVNLGNFGGIIPSDRAAEGIQVVQNEGKWYAIIVGGYDVLGSAPRVLKVEFGTDITNPSPTAFSWGNIGNMDRPIDLHLFKENNNWYGFTVNSENNTITRFDFTNSFDNTPTAVNLGNLGNLAYPTGIHVINDNGNYRVFITNGGNGTTTSGVFSLTRLDFGSSLLNVPTAINLGNPGNVLQHPRDLTIMKSCEEIVGFAVNGHPNFREIVKFNFNNDLASVPTGSTLGNIGNLGFPHSISKLFRVEDDLYGFVTNVNNNTITRFQFAGCTNASMPSSTLQQPPSITYDRPGTYNINLTIDDGLATQSSFCKQIVVLPEADFSFEQDVCDPTTVNFLAAANASSGVNWAFGDGNTVLGQSAPIHMYASFGNYEVQLTYPGACAARKTVSINLTASDVIITPDTTICYGSTKQLRTRPSLSFCWTPVTHLNDPLLPNPTTSTLNNITYYFTAKVNGTNVVTNGDFSGGNSGFTSAYSFAPSNNTEGQYFVGPNPQSWNPSLSNCRSRAGSGNMLLVNGSPVPDVNVWEQTVTILPNTNYSFSTWIQALSAANPAMLQFYINGQEIGNMITASLPTCTWSQFQTTWNSGSNTSAVISIVNKNDQVQGNDFALDDISFAPVFIQRDSVTISVERPIVRTNSDTLVCSNSAVQLTAVGASTYTWTPAVGLSSANGPNPIATPINTTQYIVTGTTANGCSANDTVIISTAPSPTVSITGDTLVCYNASTQLLAGGGVSYRWSPSTGLNDADIPNPIATTQQPTMYKVFVTGANNCVSEDSVQINIRPYPQFNASGTQSICVGLSAQLNATGGDNYLWTPGGTLSDATSPTPVASPANTTIYSVNISESTCGFDTTINTTIVVNASPVISIQKSNDINCNTPTAQLSAAGAMNYLWTPAAGLDNPNIANPEVTTDSTTTYLVTGTNEFGCSSTQSITVNASKDGVPRFVVPNAFTPNGDGKNDCFGIKRWGDTRIKQFSIYNRWGQLVFTTTNPTQCWDGTFNGKRQDAGGFAYIIRASTLCGEVLRKGIVTLVR